MPPTAGMPPPCVPVDGVDEVLPQVAGKQQTWTDTLRFFLNGKPVTVRNPDPETTLLDWVRGRGLTGTKLGCGEGGCGACMVAVSDKSGHRSVNACLAPLVTMEGCSVTTVEGVGKSCSPHPVQETLSKSHASQCGFCTPGFVVSMYAALRNNPTPSMTELEHALDGNLCRCTGYRPIHDALRAFTTDDRPKCEDPPVPQAVLQHTPGPLRFEGPRQVWFRPTSLDSLLQLRAEHPSARLIAGNTEVGIEAKFKKTVVPTVIAPTHIPELCRITDHPTHIEVGGSVTYSQLQAHLKRVVEQEPEHTTRVFSGILWMLKLWASTPIRNVGTIAGNLCTASPIGDIAQLLIAADSMVTLVSLRGTRQVRMREFFVSYRKTVLAADEVLSAVSIPRTKMFEFFAPFKTSRRKEDDIAIVNAGFRVVVSPSPPHVVQDASFSFGGMAATTVSAPKAEQAAVGKPWSPELADSLLAALNEDLPLGASAPGGQVEYRRTLAASFLFKFVNRGPTDICKDLGSAPVPKATYEWEAVGDSRPPTRSAQHFDGQGLLRDPKKVAGSGHVGEPVRHMAADLQVAGEAKYCDDVPSADVAHGFLVLSTKPHAKILSVDESACEDVEGFIAYVDKRHVKGANAFGPIIKDDITFADGEVVTAGQVIGIVVAESKKAAELAAAKVVVKYEELPAITSILEAVKQESFFPGQRFLEKGDVDAAFAKAEHVLDGEVFFGAQEHFYLETQATLATPGEAGEMDILTSSQALTKTQICVASVLGIPQNRVVARTKRMGGGFGGKESRNIFLSCAVAVAAQAVKRPVKIMMDRDVDMSTTGTRHSFMARWRVGFSSEGDIVALDTQLYANAGCSHDLSFPVLERACAHVENAYNVPNTRVLGRLCKTNLPSNTAFRGFGGPQGMFLGETAVTQVAQHLGLPPEAVREKNLYRQGDRTHYKQLIEDDNLRLCWDQVAKESALKEARAAADAFNAEHKWRKRGVSAIPVKFGMSFNAVFMNQAGALVHLYQDGTVLVSHGGTEMGQGLHTKMAQVASMELGIPLNDVYIAETATDRVANASPSAASVSADMNGYAVQKACAELLERLKPIREKLGEQATLGEVARAAHLARIDLSAHGFYITPDIGYDFATQSGKKMFHYYSNGAAVVTVEVDTLTGEWVCLSANIVHDVGLSLNPAIDIGQIEGAFVQGMGMTTMEEVMWGDKDGLPWVPQGLRFTRGPSTYKIPAAGDVPSDFRVTLLHNAPAKGVIHSSKGIGEPPLVLGSSVFFALTDAINAARRERGLPSTLLHSPASVERIRMACRDDITDRFIGISDPAYQPKGCW